MSVNLPNWNVRQYSTNVNLLLQQKGSKLRGAVSEGSYVGEQASPVDQVGSIEAQEVTSRFAPMGRIDAPLDRRWVFPSDFDLPQMVDKFDKLRLISDPESTYVTNAVYALGRKMDAKIIAAFTAAAKTGVQGAGTTNFTSANEVDVAVGGSNTRINVAKIRAVRELMKANHVDFDMEELFIGITAKDDAALLNEIEIISKEFKGGDAPVLKDGKLDTFLGFKFLHCELIETVLAGTNEVTLPVWVKSGMHLGIWGEIATNVSQRNDIQGEPFQVYAKGTFGATRLDEKKVYAIESYRA